VLDESLLADLPPGVDPCGENGEYHTFVTGGPGFATPVSVVPGEVVLRDVRWFADLLPGPAA
jgi:diphthamide synthase (EF-2-diphthine--ammonia ligase)